ncbi:hypothetical protein G9A89_012161 [Geosiphon pyriformis]|nr:hypothetical protein G9A89_012161 [Geosiphon pyriformis]
MESDSGDSVADNILAGGGDGSLLSLAATTSKAKRVKNNLDCGSPLGFLDYNMDNNDGGPLFPSLGIFLNRIWLDPKIIKTQVEVAVKKSFALDINLSATSKTQIIRKLFSRINGFGGATTPSKFKGIIRSTFTSSESMEKAVSLARENDIIVNSNLKRQGVRSDWAVVIKEISMNTLKEMIITTVSKFGQVVSIRLQLIGLWQKAVVEFAESNTGNRIRCAVICFENDKDLESAFYTEPVFGGVKLSWVRLDLVRCERCGKLSHSVLECDAKVSHSPKLSKSFKKVVSNENHLQLAKLYAKKSVSISKPAAFGGKSWAQVVFLASSSNGPHFGSGPDFGSFPSASDLVGNSSLAGPVSLILETRLASLEHSLELFTNKVSGIVGKLDSLSLVPLALASSFQPLVASGSVDMKFSSDMVLDEPDSVVDSLSLISSGVLRLVWKIAMCNVREMNNSAKQKDVIHWHRDLNNLVSIVTETKLKDKAGDINSLIAKVVNESSFVVLGGDFNENGIYKSASFKKCFDLGLVNVLARSNSYGVVKTIDYMFVSSSLINAVVNHGVTGVEDFFNTDHKAVSVSVGLSGLLDF